MMKRYDKNNDGVLDKSEWSQMSGDPEKYDRNHDGKITLDELIDGLKNWNRSADDSNSAAAKSNTASASAATASKTASPSTVAQAGDSSSGGNQSSRGSANRRQQDSPGGRSVSSTSNGPHYRGPKERLPEGLPDWFGQSDADGDGQVSMHEFAATWTDEKLAEFSKYDLNGDGFITPEEVLKVSPPKR
jgi:Ca2+-binding EF-hand superfamily protein